MEKDYAADLIAFILGDAQEYAASPSAVTQLWEEDRYEITDRGIARLQESGAAV